MSKKAVLTHDATIELLCIDSPHARRNCFAKLRMQWGQQASSMQISHTGIQWYAELQASSMQAWTI